MVLFVGQEIVTQTSRTVLWIQRAIERVAQQHIYYHILNRQIVEREIDLVLCDNLEGWEVQEGGTDSHC